jgi:hypothetical protein
VLPVPSLLAVTGWVVAAHYAKHWDRFPHLGIYSPEGRCGKSVLLEMLGLICPGGWLTGNASAPVIFRKVDMNGVGMTLLLDEAQILNRRDSESGNALRELLNGSINNGSVVSRCVCVGKHWVPKDFAVYCPKAYAHIGPLDDVLGDRSLPLRLERATKAERRRLGVKRYNLRAIKRDAAEVRKALDVFLFFAREEVKGVYGGPDESGLEPLDLANERLADLLLPLQAVLTVADPTGGLLDILQEYARNVDEQARAAEGQTDGVKLLLACREIFQTARIAGATGGPPWAALAPDTLLARLVARKDEKWATYRRNQDPLTREGLASLLKPYEIRSEFNKQRTGKRRP